MLEVDLGQLDREGSVVVEAIASGKDSLWDDSYRRWIDGVDVRLRATFAGTGEIVARGSVRGTLRQECTRCSQPVDTQFSRDLTMVFVSEPESGDDGGTYTFEPTGAILDMTDAVREEVLLSMNTYVVCDPDCQGLCSKCGVNLNEVGCACTVYHTDPRWAALQDLKGE